MTAQLKNLKIPASSGNTDLHVSTNILNDSKAVVLIVHGLAEHHGRYDYVVDQLNAFGYSVYRFDNRGHGKSGGERGYIDDFNAFIDDADTMVDLITKENPGKPIFMLGHSMGGFITAAYGVKYPGKIKGQVLSGAAITVLPIFEAFKNIDFNSAPREKVPNDLADLICRDKSVVTDYMEDPLVLKETCQKLLGEVFINGAQWLMGAIGTYNYPCLILHGGDDRIVTSDASQFMYDKISSQDKTITLYDGFYHEILNEFEKNTVLEDIRQWIDARL